MQKRFKCLWQVLSIISTIWTLGCIFVFSMSIIGVRRMLSASGLFEDWSASFIAAFIVVAFFGLVFGMVTSWKFRRYKEREELYKIRDNVRKVGERILRRKIEEMEKDSQDPKV